MTQINASYQVRIRGVLSSITKENEKKDLRVY